MKYGFTCWIVILALIQISCSSESEIKNVSQKKVVLVTYTVDTTKQNIINNYQVFFLGKDTILSCQAQKDTLIFPNQNLLQDSSYSVKFVFYDTINFLFHDVNRQLLIPDQNMTWEIRLDNKPFNEYSSYEGEKRDSSKLKKIIYWGFDLHEYGDGIMFVQKE